MRARFAVGSVVFAAIALGLVLVEGVLRLVGWPSPPLRSGWMLGNRHLTLDPDLIIVPRRLRDPGFLAPPAAPLVLAIGDSFTQGFPVELADAYPAVLERLLTTHGHPVAVRNAGMGDSGPDQQLRLLERLLGTLRPSVVVWQLYANDVWDNCLKSVFRFDETGLTPVSGAYHWLAIRQHVFDWAPLPRSVKKRSLAFRTLLHAIERAGHPATDGDPVEWSLAKIRAELAAFDELAARHGFAPYVMLVPPEARYVAHAEPAAAWTLEPHARLEGLLAGRANVIDGDLGLVAGADAFAVPPRDTGPFGDRHLNERGYARLARRVAHRLVHDAVFSARGAPSCARGSSCPRA